MGKYFLSRGSGAIYGYPYSSHRMTALLCVGLGGGLRFVALAMWKANTRFRLQVLVLVLVLVLVPVYRLKENISGVESFES